jgi:hypothetical protein
MRTKIKQDTKTKLKTKQKLRMHDISRKFTKMIILINETQHDYVLLLKRHRKVTLQTNLLCEGFFNM